MKTILLSLLFLASTSFATLTPTGANGNATELQGTPVSSTAPTTNQCLTYNGSDWIGGSCSTGSGTMVGPMSSTANDLVIFADTAGQNTSDSGVSYINLALLTGAQTIAGIKTFSSAPVMSALTASLPVCTSSGKALSSTCPTYTIAEGGTNSTTALNNNRVMVSSGGAIVEASAISGSLLMCSNSSGVPVACGSTTTTEAGYLHGVTSAIQTQLNALLSATDPAVTGYIDTNQISTPSSPASGHDRLYFKSDDNLYAVNSSGTEYQVNGGGASFPLYAPSGAYNAPSYSFSSNHGFGMTYLPSDPFFSFAGVTFPGANPYTNFGLSTINFPQSTTESFIEVFGRAGYQSGYYSSTNPSGSGVAFFGSEGLTSANDAQFTNMSASSIDGNPHGVIIDTSHNVFVGTPSLATTATNGFANIPTTAGTPTGTPADLRTGYAPVVIDSTDSKICFYVNSAWTCK